jgi:3-methyladenine DNA glycosylase Tag
VHLPYEARKTLRKKCRNKAKIEASIAEAFILEEVSNFTENLPSIYNPPPRYNAGKNESNLILFQGQLRSASASTTKQLKNEEWCSIMLYVLSNLVKVQPFIG